MMDSMPLTECLDGSLYQGIVGFVVGGPIHAKVPKVIAQQYVGPLVIGMSPQVVDKIPLPMMERAWTPFESTPVLLIDTVFTPRELPRDVVEAIDQFVRHSGDVE
jgi:hypothetical protein